jgi:hypothetical protein
MEAECPQRVKSSIKAPVADVRYVPKADMSKQRTLAFPHRKSI